MRLIDADALEKVFSDARGNVRREDDSPTRDSILLNAQILTRTAPTIDLVRHGRWIEGEKNRYWGKKGNYVCSNCKSSAGFVKFNYCPNCGARMDGGTP